MDSAAPPVDPPAAWVAVTSSPVALGEAPHGDLERAALVHCGGGEQGLVEAAREAASRALRGLPIPNSEELAFAQRASGEPHPWARAWVATAKTLAADVTLSKLDAWLAGDQNAARRRCAVATGEGPDGTRVLAVVAVDALADLAPLPTRGRTGQWLTVDARLHVPVDGGSVVVLGPSGSPRRVPSWFEDAAIRARFVLDRPGRFVVQVMASTASGPRPVAEASVFADVQPPTRLVLDAPSEIAWSAPGNADARDRAYDGDDGALLGLLATARKAAGEPPLVRDPRLDALALAHARRMVATGTLAHDDGDGDPAERLLATGLAASACGENVARATSVTTAHATLWASPSHRSNMLRRDYDRVGVAVVRDDHGDAWVVETFASGLR